MQIIADKITKRFVYKAIFANLDFQINPGEHVAVTGPNGSGKSTLLRIISGFLTASSGNITYYHNKEEIKRADIWKHVTFTAPYIDLIPSFTVEGFSKFYTKMRPFITDYDMEKFLEHIYLKEHRNKNIDNLSSGMLQRLKLGLSFFTESKLLILDEPGTNLDEKNHNWFLDCLQLPFVREKTCIIASNEAKDLKTCSVEINVEKKQLSESISN